MKYLVILFLIKNKIFFKIIYEALKIILCLIKNYAKDILV